MQAPDDAFFAAPAHHFGALSQNSLSPRRSAAARVPACTRQRRWSSSREREGATSGVLLLCQKSRPGLRCDREGCETEALFGFVKACQATHSVRVMSRSLSVPERLLCLGEASDIGSGWPADAFTIGVQRQAFEESKVPSKSPSLVSLVLAALRNLDIALLATLVKYCGDVINVADLNIKFDITGSYQGVSLRSELARNVEPVVTWFHREFRTQGTRRSPQHWSVVECSKKHPRRRCVGANQEGLSVVWNRGDRAAGEACGDGERTCQRCV